MPNVSPSETILFAPNPPTERISESMTCWNEPTLVIIGFSVRSAAQCARNAGYSVIAIDACLDRDLLALSKACHLLDGDWPAWIESNCDGLPILFAGGMEHEPELVTRLGKTRPVMGVRHSEQMKALRSIENWGRWSTEAGLGWPHTIDHVSSFHERNVPTGEWLLKSKNSAGGLGVHEIDACELEKWNRESNAIAPCYLQRKVQGQNLGVTFLSCRYGHMVLGCVGASARSRRSDLPKYIYQGSIGPFAITHPDSLGRFAEIVGHETGILGLWQADFMVNDQGWTLLEINPRWTSSMELIDSQWNVRLVDLHVQCCLQSLDKQAWANLHRQLQHTRQTSGGINKAIKYAHFDFEVSAWQSDFWWSHRWLGNSNIEEFRLADIPAAGIRIARGQPVLSVYTRCDHPPREWDDLLGAKLSPANAPPSSCQEPIAARNLS